VHTIYLVREKRRRASLMAELFDIDEAPTPSLTRKARTWKKFLVTDKTLSRKGRFKDTFLLFFGAGGVEVISIDLLFPKKHESPLQNQSPAGLNEIRAH